MKKKRILSVALSIIILIIAAFSNLSLNEFKIKQAQAGCIQYRIIGCKDASDCCTGSLIKINHIWVGGLGAYKNYATLCYK